MDSNEKTNVSEANINVVKSEDGRMRSDSFVLDLESFSNGLNKELPTSSANSRISLQRNLSRKGAQRGVERNINDKDNLSPSVSSSPPAAGNQVMSMSENAVSPSEQSGNKQVIQHQITIKTGGLTPFADGKSGGKRSRSPLSCISHPTRILLLFATLSSLGIMLLIYFTLSLSKPNANELRFNSQ